MSNIFVITSAINSPHGSVPPDRRLQQTFDTIRSIRSRGADSRIAVLEVGPTPLDHTQTRQLSSACDLLIPLHGESMLQQIYHCGSGSDFWVKTPGEIWAMKFFLSQENLVNPGDRVFKISGRYQLAKNFDFRNHDYPGRLVVKAREPAVIYHDPQGIPHPKFTPWKFNTRLYSFCGSMATVMRQKYTEMLAFVIDKYGREEFTDIEHVLFHFCQELDIVELPWIGVQGQMAPSGEYLWE